MCYVTSDDKGVFEFNTLPKGSYIVKPFYEQNNIHFEPPFIKFSIEHTGMTLDQSFKVHSCYILFCVFLYMIFFLKIIGYSLQGKVISNQDSKPICGAKIYLDGQEISVTNEDGIYTLEKIKSGTYKLTAKGGKFKSI